MPWTLTHMLCCHSLPYIVFTCTCWLFRISSCNLGKFIIKQFDFSKLPFEEGWLTCFFPSIEAFFVILSQEFLYRPFFLIHKYLLIFSSWYCCDSLVLIFPDKNPIKVSIGTAKYLWFLMEGAKHEFLHWYLF